MQATTTETAPEALEALRAGIRKAKREHLRPPPRLTLPEWADRYRRLASEAGSTGGKWETSRVEAARGPMMAVTEPGVRTISVMCCTQLMKSALLENVFGYHAHLDPCPILLIQPKDEAVDRFSKERIAPMVRATPVLRGRVGDARVKTADDTLDFKSFPGGFLAMVAAGSPTNLAMRPVRLVLMDEIDKYAPTKEGDPISLAEERMATFPVNSLSLRVCSPTEEGESRIEKSWLESDQRRAFVPCPHCGHEQVLDFFKHVHWTKTDGGEHRPETARVHCEGCGVEWSEPQRLRALGGIKWRQARPFTCCGERQEPLVTRLWRWDARNLVGRAVCRSCGKDAVGNRHAGFHASKMLDPWRPVAEVAAKWLAAKDHPESRRAFYNTQLALPYRMAAAKEASATGLLARREVYAAEIPDGVAVLTAGVDLQDDRIELEVVGWGRDEESWSVDYLILPGSPAEMDVWNRLDAALSHVYRDGGGRGFAIRAAAVDTGGHHTQRAYDFCAARAGRRIWAVKGESAARAERKPVWPRKPRRPGKNGRLPPFIIGVNAAKDAIHERLALKEPGPGYCHFPATRDADYFAQLTSERLAMPKGARPGSGLVWRKKSESLRNEAWDARIYAYAALCGLLMEGLKLNTIVDRLQATAEVKTADVVSPAPPPSPPVRRKGGWLGRRENWLTR